jgi:hypothetical protein
MPLLMGSSLGAPTSRTVIKSLSLGNSKHVVLGLGRNIWWYLRVSICEVKISKKHKERALISVYQSED